MCTDLSARQAARCCSCSWCPAPAAFVALRCRALQKLSLAHMHEDVLTGSSTYKLPTCFFSCAVFPPAGHPRRPGDGAGHHDHRVLLQREDLHQVRVLPVAVCSVLPLHCNQIPGHTQCRSSAGERFNASRRPAIQRSFLTHMSCCPLRLQVLRAAGRALLQAQARVLGLLLRGVCAAVPAHPSVRRCGVLQMMG